MIYRAFFALGDNQLVNSRGENTSIALGALDFLRRLLDRHHPDALGWVHDAGLSFRHEMFPGYKATRERLEPAQRADFDTGIARVTEILDAYHVPVLQLDGFEADDVIGTLATQAAALGVESVVVSGDKDFMQLVGHHIRVLNPWHGRPGNTTERWYDEANAHDRLGVIPERVVDYLALLGDTSDNVPGVRGIGDKTARALIERWGSLENMLDHVTEVEPARARSALEEQATEAILSKRLVTIRTDLPLALDIDRLVVREPDWPRLRDLFVALEFRLPAQDAASRADAVTRAGTARSESPLAPYPGTVAGDVRYELVDSPDGVAAVAREIRDAKAMALACMTVPEPGAPNGSHPIRTQLVGMAIGTGSGRAYYLPLRHRSPSDEPLTLDIGPTSDAGTGESPSNVRNLPGLLAPEMAVLRELLDDPGVRKFGHHIKHDVLVLRKEGVRLRGVAFDAMLASYLLDPGRRSHALEALCIEFLQRAMPVLDDFTGKGKQRTPLDRLPVSDACRYAATAANVIWELCAVLEPKLEAVGGARLLRDVELPVLAVLAEMEWTGVCIDIEWFHSLKARFARERGIAEEAIYSAAGERFNINSGRQLATVLFDRQGLPSRKKTSTGASTDASVLQQLADEGHQLPALILEYREFAKLESTYLDTLPALVNPATGRLHTSYDQAVAATGRLSSSDPNLQNIPIRRELGRDIRRGFVPRVGWKLLAADYSQVELRLLAHLSGDPAFVEAFNTGTDIHRQTASIIFDVPPESVTDEMRARAKTINFATIYGQGARALSQQLHIEHAEAKQFIDTYFTRFSGVRAFLDSTVATARERGYVETILGRRRYIRELKDRNFNIRAFGERTAQNSPIQGSAADLIKVAMIRADEAMRAAGVQSKMLLQVHDELVFEAPPAEVGRLTEIVRQAMTTAVALTVPLVVDIGVGDNWVDAKA